jgi:hypothetical protein
MGFNSGFFPILEGISAILFFTPRRGVSLLFSLLLDDKIGFITINKLSLA